MKRINIYIVHGYNVSDGGKNTTDKLIPLFHEINQDKRYNFKNLNICELDYNHFNLIQAKLADKPIGKIMSELSNSLSSGDINIFIGHSNGCAILHHASLYGLNSDLFVYVNPALDCKLSPNSTIKNVQVWHNKYDMAVTIAKYIPFTIWGDMGNVGYVGNDKRMMNNVENVKGHSAIFKPEHKNELSLIVSNIFEHIKNRLI